MVHLGNLKVPHLVMVQLQSDCSLNIHPENENDDVLLTYLAYDQ